MCHVFFEEQRRKYRTMSEQDLQQRVHDARANLHDEFHDPTSEELQALLRYINGEKNLQPKGKQEWADDLVQEAIRLHICARWRKRVTDDVRGPRFDGRPRRRL